MTDWKRKLLAFLHDPPSKPFQVAEHREVAESLVRNAFPEMDVNEASWFFNKVCDHTAAAADRVICPKASAMKADWREEAAAFKHPLGGGELRFERKITAAVAEEIVLKKQPHNLPYDRLAEEKREWARFFCHWRFWPKWCAEESPHLLYLPADTRMPDHTTWTHCSLVSALQGCVEIEGNGESQRVHRFNPAFLIVQIGPVQEFIAQARTTRDCWSGSYLLSWLIAHGIKAVTDEIGPDAILFPAMRGQPLFDFLHKEDLYDRIGQWEEATSDGKGRKLHADEQILTPNLPNRFLAVVPANLAAELAELATRAMREELRNGISEACMAWLSNKGSPLDDDAKERWLRQVGQFLTVHWQAWPWTKNPIEAKKEFHKIPAGKYASEDAKSERPSPAAALDRAWEAATKGIPFKDLDTRNYKHRSWKEGAVWKSVCVDKDGNDLKEGSGLPIIENTGFAWAAHYAEVEFLLAARRNTRDFDRWGDGCDAQRLGQDKDMFSGKEEAIGNDSWRENLSKELPWLFRSGEKLGAMNMIKRVWHKAYLKPKGLERLPRFDSVPAIAAASFAIETVDHLSTDAQKWERFVTFQKAATSARKAFPAPVSSKPDESGWVKKSDASIWHLNEWNRAIREAKTAEEKEQLIAARDALLRLQESPEKGGLGRPSCYVAVLAMDGDSMGQWVSGAKSPDWETQLADEAKEYFKKHDPLKELLSTPRHVSPSYHLQFSEALANFSIYVAGPIVEFFHGQLIFSGGDDVLAMLPAAKALACARALRMAFRGDSELWRRFDSSENFSRETSPSPFLPGKPGQDGFIAFNGSAQLWKRIGLREFLPRGYALIVPGGRTDVSAGIAIGQMNTPLQNLVEAARAAEKRAKLKERKEGEEGKGGYGKAAFAVSLFKRSGEVQEWGAKWESCGESAESSSVALTLAAEFARWSSPANGEAPALSNRFPYTLTRLLTPYTRSLTGREFRIEQVNGFDPFDVFPREIEHAMRQHAREKEWINNEGRAFHALCVAHLKACRSRSLDDFLGPFFTTAFINRNER